MSLQCLRSFEFCILHSANQLTEGIIIKMKKIITVICLSLAMVLTGCADIKPSEESEKISVVATIFPCYDFARQVGGDCADVTLLIPPGSESHSYEPTSSDIIKISGCDLFIYVGGESDKWVDEIIGSVKSGDEGLRTLKLMDCVSVLEEDLAGIVSDGEEHGEGSDLEHGEHDEYDEHVWTSLRNAEKILTSVEAVLSELDPENSEIFEKNCMSYVAGISDLDSKFTELFNSVTDKTMIFADRFPFLYFTRDYDIPYYAAFPGCASQTEPSILVISKLIDKVKEEGIKTVYYMDFSSSKTAASISEATGAETACLYSCHNVTDEQLKSGVTYLSLMTENYKTIKNGFEK